MENKGTLSRKEACSYIGMSIPTLDALLKRVENPIPSFRVGRKVFIPLEGLNAWLADEARRGARGA